MPRHCGYALTFGVCVWLWVMSRYVPHLVRVFDTVGKEWASLMRAAFAHPHLMQATVDSPQISRRLSDMIHRTVPVRQGIVAHLHSVRRRCPRLFMLSDAELLELTLGGKNLDTVSRLLTKCFQVPSRG